MENIEMSKSQENELLKKGRNSDGGYQKIKHKEKRNLIVKKRTESNGRKEKSKINGMFGLVDCEYGGGTVLISFFSKKKNFVIFFCFVRSRQN